MDEEKNEKIDQEIPVPEETTEETVVTPEVPQEEKTEEAFDASTFTPTSRRSKKKKKKNPILKILLIFVLLAALVFGGAYLFYTSSLKPVSKEDKEVIVTIDKGSTVTKIAETLEENGVIRSSFVFRLYAKQHKISNMQAGTYKLNTNMEVDRILDMLSGGSKYYPDMVNVTFVEGKNMRWIAKKIADTTNNSQDSVFATLQNTSYIDSLIQKYWFLTNDIKDTSIYYPLEGYLFPDTYSFENKDVRVETIFEAMLDQMDKKLTPYRSEIESSNYSVHEILTLASVVESEGANKEARANIASVFYNRLKSNMSLGSDVTTYYAIKVDMSERDLKKSEISKYNPYNTRGPRMNGKLPIGPIGCSSMESIKAAIEPSTTDYLYFVADKNGKVYFTKTNQEHNAKVSELKANGLWSTYGN